MKSPDKRNLSGTSPAYSNGRGQQSQRTESPGGDNDALSDEELISLVVEKSREALEILYNRYSGAVYSLAMHMLRDVGAAEEVTQDSFFNVWRRGASYRSDRGKVTSWLFSIAHHRVIDELRRRRRREQLQVAKDVDTIQKADEKSPDPTKYATQQMQKTKIAEALTELRPEQRDVVVLAYYGGLTHSEIAKKLEQPLGTVKTRMRLALKKLREVMGSQAREWLEYGL
jgi:RNA polymerase sigma-70 factor (ECF subfamily)